MKTHIGIDASSGMVHSITATPANVNDIVETHKLIRKDDDVVYGDAGSKQRCKVEHSFQMLKCLFGFRKVCYSGIAKNLNKLFILFASVNLVKYARLIR